MSDNFLAITEILVGMTADDQFIANLNLTDSKALAKRATAPGVQFLASRTKAHYHAALTAIHASNQIAGQLYAQNAAAGGGGGGGGGGGAAASDSDSDDDGKKKTKNKASFGKEFLAPPPVAERGEQHFNRRPDTLEAVEKIVNSINDKPTFNLCCEMTSDCLRAIGPESGPWNNRYIARFRAAFGGKPGSVFKESKTAKAFADLQADTPLAAAERFITTAAHPMKTSEYEKYPGFDALEPAVKREVYSIHIECYVMVLILDKPAKTQYPPFLDTLEYICPTKAFARRVNMAALLKSNQKTTTVEVKTTADGAATPGRATTKREREQDTPVRPTKTAVAQPQPQQQQQPQPQQQQVGHRGGGGAAAPLFRVPNPSLLVTPRAQYTEADYARVCWHCMGMNCPGGKQCVFKFEPRDDKMPAKAQTFKARE